MLAGSPARAERTVRSQGIGADPPLRSGWSGRALEQAPLAVVSQNGTPRVPVTASGSSPTPSPTGTPLPGRRRVGRPRAHARSYPGAAIAAAPVVGRATLPIMVGYRSRGYPVPEPVWTAPSQDRAQRLGRRTGRRR